MAFSTAVIVPPTSSFELASVMRMIRFGTSALSPLDFVNNDVMTVSKPEAKFACLDLENKQITPRTKLVGYVI